MLHKSTSLNYEPSSEPFHISAKKLLSNYLGDALRLGEGASSTHPQPLCNEGRHVSFQGLHHPPHLAWFGGLDVQGSSTFEGKCARSRRQTCWIK